MNFLAARIDKAFLELTTPRDPRWGKAQHAHLQVEPCCRACGTRNNLNVHHIRPVHLFPLLELAPENMVTLCRDHHFVIGHLRNWRDWNPNVLDDAAANMAKYCASPLARKTFGLTVRRWFGLAPTEFTKTHGTITSYGYPNDECYDWNSAHGIGAWSNKLQGYKSMAVSPDIQQAFRSAGIDPLGGVEIQCANGDVLSLAWDDKTSSRLTGRFDIYSPRARAAHEGQTVTRFRRI